MSALTCEPTATTNVATDDALHTVGLVDLAELGLRVADDGPAVHHPELVLLSCAVEALAPATAQVLRDSAAPEVARTRALAVASAALRRSSC